MYDVGKNGGKLNAKVEHTNSGIGFAGLLQIAFIILKLMKVIEWSWVWVLSPIWISISIWVVIIVVFFLIVKSR